MAVRSDHYSNSESIALWMREQRRCGGAGIPIDSSTTPEASRSLCAGTNSSEDEGALQKDLVMVRNRNFLEREKRELSARPSEPKKFAKSMAMRKHSVFSGIGRALDGLQDLQDKTSGFGALLDAKSRFH